MLHTSEFTVCRRRRCVARNRRDPCSSAIEQSQEQRATPLHADLSRHGVRPPLATNSNLNLRSSDPWPVWEVPLGYLTPHGALAIEKMGAYMRLDLRATDCARFRLSSEERDLSRNRYR